MKLDKKTILLIFILFISLFLRLHALSENSLWVDESYTVYHAQKSISENVKISSKDIHPPLHNIIMGLWTRLFGISELSVRLPSALFGTLAVFLIFLIGKTLANKKVGLYAASILTVSPFNITYSQQARAYSLLMALGLASFYFYLKFIESDTRWNRIGYIASTILLIYTHYFSIFILLVQNIHILFTKIKKKSWILNQSLLLLAYSPWVIISFSHLSKFNMRSRGALHFFDKIHYTLSVFSGGTFLLSIFIVLALAYLAHAKYSKENLLLWMWLLIPLIPISYVAILSKGFYEYKYVIFSSAALYLLIAKSINALWKKHLVQITVFSIIIISSSFYIPYVYNIEIEQWRTLANYLNNEREDEMLFVSGGDLSLAYYYMPHCFKEKLQSYKLRTCLEKERIHLLRTNEKKNLTENAWLIKLPWRKETYNYLKNNYNLTEQIDFGRISLSKFEV